MPHIPTPRKHRLYTSRGGRRTKPVPDFTHNPYRWYVADYHHYWLGTLLYIVVTTDVPCHLWLYWTNRTTRMHLRGDIDSGYAWLWEPKYCFVQHEEIEQVEPGDTTLHHFLLPGWDFLQTKWWVFIATMGGNYSVSVSCIFKDTMRLLELSSSLEASVPILHLVYPPLVDRVQAYHPIPLAHQRTSVGATLTISHPMWLMETPTMKAILSEPAPRPPSPISASLSVDLWEPLRFTATIQADYDTEVT